MTDEGILLLISDLWLYDSSSFLNLKMNQIFKLKQNLDLKVAK